MCGDPREFSIDVTESVWFDAACRDRLVAVADVLVEAQRIGIIGNTDVDLEVVRAMTFAAALHDQSDSPEIDGAVLDLGSGGGLPGLVIAACCPHRAVVLSDRRAKRTDFLRRAVRRLRWQEQVSVVSGELPAVVDGRRFSSVTARLFAEPSVLFEVAAAVVCGGGQLLVTDGPAWVSAPVPEAWLAGGVIEGRLDLDALRSGNPSPSAGGVPPPMSTGASGRRVRRFVAR